MNAIAGQLGEVGLPALVAELASRRWDVVVVGGRHNGLTGAAYLARAGPRVLVLERRERLGGAGTLERPFADPGYVVSPCAYVVGLLDELVIRELGLKRRGLHVDVADPNLWVPFPDGTSFGQWLDDARTACRPRGAGRQPRTWRATGPTSASSTPSAAGCAPASATPGWATRRGGPSSRSCSRGEQAMIDVVFDASIAEVLDDHIRDQRLKDALFGQGVIGA